MINIVLFGKPGAGKDLRLRGGQPVAVRYFKIENKHT
jgi:hypothetical protein